MERLDPVRFADWMKVSPLIQSRRWRVAIDTSGGPTVTQSTIWVGLDVHKDSITAAIFECDEPRAEIQKLFSDLHKVRRLFRLLPRQLTTRGPVRSCCEASGAGFVLQRALSDHGYHCEVVAPSLIPRKPGDCRKTDRVDAIMLAKLLLSEHLPPIDVPGVEQEAVRGLVRSRHSVIADVKRTKRRISGFLLRQGLRFVGTETVRTGLVPSERSSGDYERRGPLTKAGNSEVRRVVIEAGWNNRHQAGSTPALSRLRQGQPPEIVAIAAKAQHRLSRKFRRLWERKHPNVAVVSVAREACGFVWAIMNAAPQHQPRRSEENGPRGEAP